MLVITSAAISPDRLAAHPNLQDSLWLQVEPERLRVAVDISVREISVAAQRDAATVDFSTLAILASLHQSYLATHLEVSAAGVPLSGRMTSIQLPPALAEPESTFVQFELEYAWPQTRPAQIELRHQMLREWSYAPGVAWNVTYVTRTLRLGESVSHAALLNAGRPLAIATGWPNHSETRPTSHLESRGGGIMGDYLPHGIAHILQGFDHLLFVCALVLAVRSLLELVQVIAAFTLAHTVTLALAVYGIVHVPPSFVEPAIALSIVCVALGNLLPADGTARRWRGRLTIAFGFGLVHGLGFAGGLLDAMRTMLTSDTLLSLASFSVGVEVGHQMVVLPLFALLWAGRRTLAAPTHDRVLRTGSYAVTCGGAYFLVISLPYLSPVFQP